MAMFNSYVSLPEGNHPLNPIKPPFSYGFPMVFPLKPPTPLNFMPPSPRPGDPRLLVVLYFLGDQGLSNMSMHLGAEHPAFCGESKKGICMLFCGEPFKKSADIQ